jgi:phosphoglycerate kinase
MLGYKTIDDVEVSDKKVLMRADLNVPMVGGKISDFTRIKRVAATVNELAERGAKVIVASHFGRPDGRFVPEFSLAPIADALSVATGKDVKFAVDCVGTEAENAVNKLHEGEILLLENLRFYAEEEKNDAEFSKKLASLAEVYVNDAFSCSHRAHASIVGVTKHLPAAAGRLMQEELENLENILGKPQKPVSAIIGGSKISTKLELLNTLISKVDIMVIGGAMANTFLKAQGKNIGKSLHEANMLDTATEILKAAKAKGCEIILPTDVVVAQSFKAHAENKILHIDSVNDGLIIDVGPETVAYAAAQIAKSKTLVWNGPLGAFEHAPFDGGTVSLARYVSALCTSGKLKVIAGGGDTVSAISHAGLTQSFTYLSTAGGAFLEWLEGKELPGVTALKSAKKAAA